MNLLMLMSIRSVALSIWKEAYDPAQQTDGYKEAYFDLDGNSSVG